MFAFFPTEHFWPLFKKSLLHSDKMAAVAGYPAFSDIC